MWITVSEREEAEIDREGVDGREREIERWVEGKEESEREKETDRKRVIKRKWPKWGVNRTWEYVESCIRARERERERERKRRTQTERGSSRENGQNGVQMQPGKYLWQVVSENDRMREIYIIN